MRNPRIRRAPSARHSPWQAGALALAAAAVLGGSAFAQSPTTVAQAPLLDDGDLRPSTAGDLPTDLRAPTATPSTPPPIGDQRLDYEPFGRGADDATDRPGTADEPSPEDAEEEEDALPASQEPRFDLFEGPDGRPVPPANIAAQPALPGGAVDNLPATTTSPEAQDRNGDLRQAGGRNRATDPRGRTGPVDPLVAARNGGLPERDLALPASAARTETVDNILGRQNLAITPLRGAIPIAEDDPFAPVGIRAGTFVLYSTLEQSVGASSNLSNSVDGTSGVFSETALSGRLLSDWSRHEFELNSLASYRRNFAGELTSEPRIAIDGRLRLDVDRLTTATLRGAFEYRQEDPIDLDAGDSLTDRPDIFNYSAGLELERAIGRTTVALDTSLVRQQKSTPETPATISVLDESFTTYTTALRTGYEISPALKPFVEGSIGLRRFDDERDLAGIERNSTIQALRTGVEFDLGEKFLGEVAAGYAWNVPEADGGETIGAPTIDARVAWSPQRGTDVVFTAATNFDPDTDGSGTSTLYEGAVALRHRLTNRTDLTATLSAAYRDSDVETEVETSYAAEAGFTYWLNRSLAFTGLLRHEALDATIAGGDYTAQTAKLGIRLQR